MQNDSPAPEIISQSGSSEQDLAKFASEAGLSVFLKTTGRLIGVVGQIILARILGPSILGLFTIGYTTLRLVQIFAPLGVQNGVIWFGSRFWKTHPDELRGLILKSILISTISGGVISAFFYIAAPSFAVIYDAPDLLIVMRWFAISFLFVSVLRVATAATRISQKIKYSVFTEDLFQPVTFFLLVVLFYFLNLNFFGALFANLFSFVTAAFLAVYFIYKLFFQGKKHQIIFSLSTKEILKYSLPTAFTGVLGATNIWIDRLLIGLYRPTFDVGVYQAASQSSMLFTIILSSINSIIAPMFADLYHQNQKERLDELYKVSTKWGFYLGIPIFLVILFNAATIIKVLFGTEYLNGSLPMILLSLGQLFNLSTGAVSFLLIMTGNQNIWLVINISSLILNVVLNAILTSLFGIVGTAISTSISVAVLFGSGLFAAKKLIGVWPYDKRYLKGIIASIVTMITLYLSSLLSGLPELIYLVLISVLAYGIFLFTLSLLGFDEEDKRLGKMIYRKIIRSH